MGIRSWLELIDVWISLLDRLDKLEFTHNILLG